MWILKNTNNNRQYFLPCNKDIFVGRKDVDIVISGDSSVSRNHGKLHIEHPRGVLKNPDAVSIVTCSDTSKFGTFVTHLGEHKIKVDKTENLKPGDIIQFGAQHSIFELIYSPLVITTSMLENDIKEKLAESLLRIGGYMVNNWHGKVTHLVVEKIKLSIKVTQSLVSARHIVTPEFVSKIDAILGSVGMIPDPLKCVPELAEPNLSQEVCCFKVNKKRETIFNDRLFLFLSKKQHKHMGPIISAGGGKCLLIDDTSIDDDVLIRPRTTIISCVNINLKDAVLNSSRYEHVQEILLMNELRLVGEHEIGLAVLYCDATVYCNPAFDLNSQNVFTQRHSLQLHSDRNCDPSSSSEASATCEKRAVNTRESRKDALQQETALLSGTKSKSHQSRSSASRSSRKRSLSPEAYTAPERGDEPVHDFALDKKPKIADIPLSESDSQVIPETANPPTENMPDSYLDDDNLWSQNFDSLSSSRQEEGCKNPMQERNPRMVLANPEPYVKRQKPLRNNNVPASIDSVVPQIKCELTSPDQQPFVRPSYVHSPDVNLDKVKSNQDELHPASVSSDHIAPGCYDPSLPVGLAQISVRNLVAKRRQVAMPRINATGTKTFKRFRKVWPTYMANQMLDIESNSSHPPIPRIIGGSDFFAFGEKPEKNLDIGEWLDQESQSSNPFLQSTHGVRNRI